MRFAPPSRTFPQPKADGQWRVHNVGGATCTTIMGGQSGGGQTSSAGQSVGPEALKLQEMWDGLEGLRRGAWLA
eukprot:1141696-Pelagomonas_calceolata.AAC.4